MLLNEVILDTTENQINELFGLGKDKNKKDKITVEDVLNELIATIKPTLDEYELTYKVKRPKDNIIIISFDLSKLLSKDDIDSVDSLIKSLVSSVRKLGYYHKEELEFLRNINGTDVYMKIARNRAHPKQLELRVMVDQ